jgi:hypothetical protein
MEFFATALLALVNSADIATACRSDECTRDVELTGIYARCLLEPVAHAAGKESGAIKNPSTDSPKTEEILGLVDVPKQERSRRERYKGRHHVGENDDKHRGKHHAGKCVDRHPWSLGTSI